MRDVDLTGCSTPPRISVIVVDGGNEVEVQMTCRLRIAECEEKKISAPRRWELLECKGKTYCVAGLLSDDAAGEYVLQLANPELAAHFS